MVMRVLVTTANEETWPENEPVLFLGEWCKRFSRKERWSVMDAEVLPYHWDDRNKLFADYQYLYSFYERVLLDIAAKLNQIHGVRHNVRYWRILIGPWLINFIQILFDRWTTIQQAITEYEISGAYILSASQTSFVPNDMMDHYENVLNDDGNEHIYATILQQFTNVPCTILERQKKTEVLPEKQHFKRRIKGALINAYIRCASIFSSDTDVFLFMAGMPFSNVKKLLLRLRQVPQIWHTPTMDRVSANTAHRQWSLNGEVCSDFEAVLQTLIPQFIPTTYLEGYEKLVERAENLPWPKRPKLIYTTSGLYAVEVFKAWTAEKTECGSKLVIGQHGGQYGIGLCVIHEQHETEIADCFLSWGWYEPENTKVKPVGMLTNMRPLDVHHASQSHMLMVAGGIPRYSFWLRTFPIARQLLDYFDDQCAFVECLPEDIRNALVVRVYREVYGWDLVARWNNRFQGLTVDSGLSDMTALIKQSRIFVTTYNATAYLESFAMNVPTIIFWNPNQWELRESAKPYFEGLKRVGVFHDTPQSAAEYVKTIWDDVDAWWNSAEVRDEVARFSQRYSRIPDNLMNDIEGVFRSVLKN